MEPTDFELITDAFDRAGVTYREASAEEADDLADRFGVKDSVRRGDFSGSPRALFLARNEGRTPGPVLLFDRDANYVGLGDDRTRPAATLEFYGRTG